MEVLSFLTISVPSEGYHKDSGSKFLAFAYPVQSEEAIRKHLTDLKKKYFDAHHHCFAWMLGSDKTRFRSFDDGEPNHSAGDPILGQIRSRNLTNILIVVVRYFGGVKLGVGGLIQAYKAAADDALRNAKICEHEVIQKLQISFAYDYTADVMRLVKEFDLEVVNQSFLEDCLLQIIVKQKFFNSVKSRLDLLKVTGHLISYSQAE